MKRIFISYRRRDTAGWSGRLANEIRRTYSEDACQVFQDVRSNRIGEDYVARLLREATGSDMVIALIGTNWTGDEGQRRRIDASDDMVRRELVEAEKGGALVVPVFVDGADWSHVDPLPADLEWLRRRHAVSIRVDEPEQDISALLDRLGDELDLPRARSATEARSISAGTYIESIVAPGSTFEF